MKPTSKEHKRREDDADLHLARTIVQNKQYNLGEDDEYGFDVAPSKKNNKKKKDVSEDRNFSKRILTQQERCQFCFENPSRPKHLVVSIANFTYLMLPQWQPIVEGHCCILPMQVGHFPLLLFQNSVFIYLAYSYHIAVFCHCS